MYQWLRDEFLSTRDRVRGHHVSWLTGRGVTAAALAAAGGFGVARVLVERDRFDLADGRDADPAIILPVSDLPNDLPLDGLYDLVAFLPARPDRFYLRRGDAIWLNPFSVEKALSMGLPALLRRTPLSWLEHGADGAVPLDWARAAPALLDFASIEGEDEAHVREISVRLQVELMTHMPLVRAQPTSTQVAEAA